MVASGDGPLLRLFWVHLNNFAMKSCRPQEGMPGLVPQQSWSPHYPILADSPATQPDPMGPALSLALRAGRLVLLGKSMWAPPNHLT